MAAVTAGNIPAVAMLLAAGADPELMDDFNRTPLAVAVQQDAADIGRLLPQTPFACRADMCMRWMQQVSVSACAPRLPGSRGQALIHGRLITGWLTRPCGFLAGPVESLSSFRNRRRWAPRGRGVAVLA